MAILHLLGTGGAVTAPHRTTTMLAFTEGERTLLIDCGGDVVQRLHAAKIPLDTLRGLILTHEHPDHVGGFPLFMEKIWLEGRRAPLPVYGPAAALDQARRCFDTFDTSRWQGLPEVVWREVTLEERVEVLSDAVWRVTATPGRHSVPVIGLRVQCNRTGGVVAYSCDTEPSGLIARLGHRADIFVHEANGRGKGHSSAGEAAEVAREAEARRLILVHLPPVVEDAELRAAREVFPDISLGQELGRYSF